MTQTAPKIKRVSRAAAVSAAVSALLAVACHFLPPKYQAVCTAVSQIVPVVCSPQ